MNEADKKDADSQTALREKAESLLRGISVDVTELSTEEIQNLMHELQVHQIELEMQNDELQQAQLQLAESRDQYVNLYDYAPVGYLTITEKGLIDQVNLTCATLLGVERENLLKTPFSRFVSRNDQDTYYRFRRQILQSNFKQTCELKLVTQAGTEFNAKLESIIDEDGKIRTTLSDITDRVQIENALRASHEQLETTLAELKGTQAQMVQQERLAAVGQLAAGIAHDFNNIMAAVLLQAQIMLTYSDLTPNDRQKAERIEEQALRAADLVQQILDFSRKSIMHRENIDLCLFLEELNRLLMHTLLENIDLSITCQVDTCMVNGDPTRLQQAVLNLAINARDAMPYGGKLQIKLDHVKVGENGKRPYPKLTPGQWAQISVTDSGTGIPDTILDLIFEPFFTTRAPLGSGLGLSQVYGIIKQHNGFVDVATTVGKGTTFTLYLPMLTEIQPGKSSPQPNTMILGNEETILIVEDNHIVREALTDAISALNYQPLSVENGHKALALCQSPDSNISLVITDLIMPEMGGDELLNTLRSVVPDIKVIIITGYPLADQGAKLISAGAVSWLQKPVKLYELSQQIASAIKKQY